MDGKFYRTTLVEANNKKWYVMELCEQLEGLVQLDSQFHELHGRRNVITFITESEKDPRVMGFSLVDKPDEVFPVEADADQDIEVMDVEPPIEGRDVHEGHIVVQPIPEYEVNGTVLRETSSLAALHAGSSFYGVSSSGSKQKCFKRLIEHSKKLELELVMAAGKEAFEQQERHPLAPVSAEVPTEYEQSQHRLTHVPYKQWCPSCLAHRARADRHERSGESHAGAVPTISFDYFFTKSDGQAGVSGSPDTLLHWWSWTAIQALCHAYLWKESHNWIMQTGRSSSLCRY